MQNIRCSLSLSNLLELQTEDMCTEKEYARKIKKL